MNTLIWKNLSLSEKNKALARPSSSTSESLSQSVSGIISQVQKERDKALFEFTKRFDQVQLESFKVTENEFQNAIALVSEEVKSTLKLAYNNIYKFHKAQEFTNITVETTPGVLCEQVSRPITSVGLYVPGGTAPLPSTVLMLGIPAQIAKCEQVQICTPPNSKGEVDPTVLVAAKMAGIDSVFKLGGAHAIAAMAYGTESIPKVDKIFGPGNSWVTEAKVQVAQDSTGATCDMPAGPSEVLVIADHTASPDFVAADLLSQAEHGTDSQSILVTDCPALAEKVSDSIQVFSQKLGRREILSKSLKLSRTFIVSNMVEAITVSNKYAPEHLIIQAKDSSLLVPKITHAGSIFVGPWTPESVGDYASGTNHVLPTYGFAKSISGLNLDAFSRKMTVQTLTRDGLAAIGPSVITLSKVEGLDAHGLAVSVRLESMESNT